MAKKQLHRIMKLNLLGIMIIILASYVYALEISNVEITDISAHSARVKWFTDEVADGKVMYGQTAQLGFTSRHNTFIFEHELVLQNLDSETTYFFEIESSNIQGQAVKDNNNNQLYSFTTKDINPPDKIQNLAITEETKDAVSMSWSSSSASDLSHYNIYRDRIKVANSSAITFTDTGLNPGTTYSYKVAAVDLSGNEGIQSDTAIATTKPIDVNKPVIANVDITDIKDASATIAWLTNEDSTSVVYFSSGTLDRKKELEDLVKNHSVTLQDLVKGTTYSFIVSSCDGDDNCINSSQSSFEAGIDLIPPYINTTIPRFFNKGQIDITGLVEPFSKISLFVNDLNFPVRALDSTETSNGKFEFLNVQLQKENVIKIVATDKSGNKNESILRLSVDTEDPVVVTDEISNVISKKNLTIVGTVNEPVTINFFLRFGTESKPGKVKGLKAEASNNSIKIEWNESAEKEFSHYIIYRDDVGPIAIANSKTYNTFTDLLVNKNVRYTYRISQVNKFGKESELSDSADAITRQGLVDIPKPKAIDKLIIEKPALTVDTNSTFSGSLSLTKDGSYTLLMEVQDRANNRVVIENVILLDTRKPDIKITSPPSGTFIYENYANEIDIRGITDPNARVHLYVERTPLGFLNNSADISGLPNRLENIPESDLDASCGLDIGSKNFCPESADFSTTADSAGNFEFDDVDLTSVFSGGFRVRQVPSSEFIDERRFDEADTSRLVFVATDQAGLRNAKEHRIRIGTCWAGNQSWDLIPLAEFQSPTFINPQRLADNKESIYFFFNYSYIGRGIDAKINSVSIQRACAGTETLGDKRFNTSCQILPSGGFSSSVNPEGTLTYTQIGLNRLEGMDRFLQNDWQDFSDSISNELTFPLKFTIRYTHKVDGKDVVETQTTCQEVTYVLDNSIIDPREILPDWLLYDAVDFLQDSIETINDINNQLSKVLDFATVGCVSSFTLRIGFQVLRRFQSFAEEKIFQIKNANFLPGSELIRFTGAKDEDQEYCNAVAKNIMSTYKLKGTDLNPFNGIKLSYFSDPDLKRCFPSVADAWDNEAFWYRAMRFTCDRVFGHETPSAWTENLPDDQIFQRIQEGEQCAIDQSVFGQPLRQVSCRDVAKQFFVEEDFFKVSDQCFVRSVQGGNQLFLLGKQIDGINGVYEITRVRERGSFAETKYAIKQTETSYLTNQPQTCEQVCGIGSKGGANSVTTSEGTFSLKNDDRNNVAAACVTANQCNSWNAEKKNEVLTIGGKDVTVESAKRRGYTEGCFFPEDPQKVSDNPETRIECCCLNTAGKKLEAVYYIFNDVNKYESPGGGKANAFESKEGEDPPNDFNEVKWSYRYWKEKYIALSNENGAEHNQYNPNRYIEGRDQPACFGQNNWLYDGLLGSPGEDETGNLVVIDSRQQFSSSFQCLNIAGVQNRLTLLNNIQNALASCLIDIRETGTSDSAACREIFTRYVCSTAWDAIQFVNSIIDGNSCSPFSAGIEFDSETDYAATIGAGFKSVTQSITDAQTELASEYGNAELNNLVGTGAGEIARKVCLGAFGYDWDLNIQNVIDAAYSQSFETLVQKTTGSREYLTIDPTSGQARYDYRASWIINPGCDIENYKVELACVGRNQIDSQSAFFDPVSELSRDSLASRGVRCDAVGSPDGNNCDCINQDEEKVRSFFTSRGGLDQNQFIQEAEDEIIPSQYRYDHLKFTIRPDREIRSSDRSTCFPPGHENGVFYFPISDKTARDVASCKLEPISGVYQCTGALDFWSQKGLANLVDIEINGKEVEDRTITLFRGEDLRLTPTVFKTPGSPNKCLVAEIKKAAGVETAPATYIIDRDGAVEYPEIPLETDVQPSRNIRTLQSPRATDCNPSGSLCNSMKNKRMTITKIERQNIVDVDNTLVFIDENGNGNIELTESSQDRMVVNGIDNTLGRGGWWDDEFRGPVVDTNGVKFKITNVPFAQGLEDITYIQDITQVTEDGSDDRWTLTLSLYGADEVTKTCNNYNAGELIKYNGVDQQFSYDIRIKAQGQVANAPKISLNFGQEDGKTKKTLNPGDDKVNLNVEITDETGVDDDLVYNIIMPDQFSEQKEAKCSILSASGTGETRACSLVFDHNSLGVNNANIGGTYRIKFQARDTDPISHTTEAETSIEVKCGTDDSNTGICVNPSQCRRDGTINDGIVCRDGFVCCPTATT